MPELPDVVVYIEALEKRLLGRRLEGVRLASPFFLRSVRPAITEVRGRRVTAFRRLGKRIVFALEGDLFFVYHPMVAGRLRFQPAGAKIPGRLGLAAFDFENGTLLFTEAGTKKRAALHLVEGEGGLEQFARGGLEVLTASSEAFAAALCRENHTLKRALTDPRLFSGIGNAYSDEILHRARLSPLKLTSRLESEETDRLFAATQEVLTEWIERLRRDAGDGFPEKVTAFRDGMAVHGRYGQPCPACGAAIQRIVYAENECNYCAHCQNEDRLLRDRALSRLLKEDWPATLQQLEEGKADRGA
jgi:formamidopyrimidine-DNA glycosylase